MLTRRMNLVQNHVPMRRSSSPKCMCLSIVSEVESLLEGWRLMIGAYSVKYEGREGRGGGGFDVSAIPLL